MFQKLELIDKMSREGKSKGKTYIGYDLGAGYGEISVFSEDDLEPVTLLSRKDANVFHFPCLLVKYKGRFYAGFEAMSLAGEEEAFVFQDLLETAMKQQTIVVGGQRFDTEYLLGLFLKLTLTLPEAYGKIEKIGGIMFTTYIEENPELQAKVYEVLTRATSQLFHRKTKLYLQTRSESIYYFLLHQEEDIFDKNALICDYQKDYLRSYFVKKQGETKPYVITVDYRDYPEMRVNAPRADELSVATKDTYTDEVFHRIIYDLEDQFDYGISYMIGDGFKGNWMDHSLVTLCNHGKVFQGNNLYSLGACYSLRQLIEPTELIEEYLYLSNQDIRYDVGIYCKTQGFIREGNRQCYMQIFEKGTYFEQCKSTLCFLLEGENKLVIELTPMAGGLPKHLEIPIGLFPNRSTGASKIRVSMEFTDPVTLSVMIEDIGLGEVVPGSGKVIQETFHLE